MILETAILFFPTSIWNPYIGTVTGRALSHAPPPKRNASGLGMRCHIDELEGRQGVVV